MQTPESVYNENKNADYLRNEMQRESFKEMMLQLSWFRHRCEVLYQEDGKKQEVLRSVSERSEAQAQRVTEATPEEEWQILVEEMIDSPIGSKEAEWFRVHFPSDKGLPLAPEYRLVLDTFETDPDGANAQLDQLFQASVTTH